MHRRILIVLTLALLLALPALAESQREEAKNRRQEHAQAWQDLTPAQRERGLERAEARGLFARFSHDAGTGQASGNFLRFHVQADAGAIHGVAVRANRTLPLTPFLAAVTPDAFTMEEAPKVHGATLSLSGTPLDLRAHNNPTAGMMWHADAPVNLTFVLEAGLRPVIADPQEIRVTLGATHAHIISNGAPLQVGADNRTLVARLQAGDAAMVRVHPVGETLAGGLHDLNKAFKEHRLGATLRIADADGAAAVDGEGVDVQANTRSIARGRVVVDIESAQPNGRVLFLTFANGTFDAARPGEVGVSLDGTNLRRVATTPEVLAAGDGAYTALPSDDGQTLAVVVGVPHFSGYALAITQATDGTGTSTATTTSTQNTPGIPLGLTLLLVGLAVGLRRRE